MPLREMKPRSTRLCCVAASLALLALAGCGAKKEKPKQTPEAGFVVVKTQDVPVVNELAGRVTAFETSEVRPQVTGIIKARLFTEGATVRQGQPLYRIDPRVYAAQADQAAANLQSAEANRVATSQRAERLAPLAKIEAVAAQDLTDAVALSRQAAATVAQNRAALQAARVNLAFTTVPAPITGRINRSLFTTGALVTSGQADPLTTIQRLDPIFVDMQQSSADLLALRRATGGRPSSAVKLQLEDGSTYPLQGRVQFSEAMVDPSTGAVTLRARFPNPQGVLLPGMYVRASLAQSIARGAVLVPQQGVTRDPKGGATVLLVGPGNKAVIQPIQTDRTVGDAWLVTGGLKPGQRVIVEGLAKIKPDQLVKPVPAGSKPTPPAKGGRSDSGGGAGSGRQG